MDEWISISMKISVLSRDDVGRLPYLSRCIKESMRLHTPVPLVMREVEREFELDGVTLPVGTTVDVNIHLMHNNKAVWGDDYQVSRIYDVQFYH